MTLVGVGGIYAGGWAFLGLLAFAGGLMVWELLRMVAPNLSKLGLILVPALAALCILRVGYAPSNWVALALIPLAGLFFLNKNKLVYAAYTIAIVTSVVALYLIRIHMGMVWTFWLMLVVIASDLGGYFAGRMIGGAKIFPRISPKKTWSGSIGGLVLAGIVGAVMGAEAMLDAPLFLLSMIIAAAAQAGDVVESAIKRANGIKDSSNLIPGHGGLLDRFDGLIGAALLFLAINLSLGFPAGM